ncbi:hypothetical protein [Carnobacterium sp. TMP28]|uniref:hypothetical protein n=1 Tax=Carnobacterium sp. TMP28 TaxID=3397060 RepID=UPI0039E06494
MTINKAKQQYFGGIQVIEYRISDKEAFIDALLIIYGFSSEGNVSDGMIEALAKGDDGAAVEWLTKTFDES